MFTEHEDRWSGNKLTISGVWWTVDRRYDTCRLFTSWSYFSLTERLLEINVTYRKYKIMWLRAAKVTHATMHEHTNTRAGVWQLWSGLRKTLLSFNAVVFRAQRSDVWTEREFYYDFDKDLSLWSVVPEHGETSRGILGHCYLPNTRRPCSWSCFRLNVLLKW